MGMEKEPLDDKELEKINGGVSSHVDKTAGKNYFKCDLCGMDFETKEERRKHMKKLHKVSI